MDIIVNKLKEVAHEEARPFISKTAPNVKYNSILGVKIPDIRKIAKEIKNDEYIDKFLNELPHKYLEENLLHGILLSIKYPDIDMLLSELDKFLIYADNWMVTDIISPKLFNKYLDIVYEKIKEWINSNNEYMVRFGIVSLLQFYLKDNLRKDELELVRKVKFDSYYVNMAKAWFYSYALIHNWDTSIKLFENKKLNKWIHNKSIQKAIESYRISNDRKEYLRTLKIK